jgi:photosystem II stability/assembly factor-like uncharacterized protein
MFTASTGWAEAQSHVFSTSDGGAHWLDVTPKAPDIPTPSGIESTYFLSAAQAWVAIGTDGASPDLLFRTSNAGATWQETHMPTQTISTLTFLNPQDGWLLANANGAAGSEAVDVYRTTDGGATWKKVASATPDNKGGLPFGGDKTGISFVSPTTGWITGEEPIDNFFWLYTTEDGGTTWKQQTLPLLPGVPKTQYVLSPPTFFDAQHGLLQANYFTTASTAEIVLYTTQDGGQTWQANGMTPNAAQVVDALDLQHLWATDGATLYTSSDSGQHWSTLTTNATYKNVGMLGFLSPQLGFALSATDSGSFVLKTLDGGQTWAIIQPTTK